MAKFTFKKHPRETGLASVAHPYPCVDVKMNGKVVGLITPPSAFGGDTWRVRFMIVAETERCGWAWATLKAHYASEQEARDYIMTHGARIQEKLCLRARAD